MKNVVIFGATSAIAQAVAQGYAQRNYHIVLIGRNHEKLEHIQADLKVRGARAVNLVTQDLLDTEAHLPLVNRLQEELGQIDIVLLAHGTLPDQKQSEASYQATHAVLESNALSHISLLTTLAHVMENQNSGALAVISSVAGDRGRQSNYIYGTAKAALTVFCQGLRNRLAKTGIQVLTIKPGFVDTPMTADFEKGPLWASPEKVASDIISAIDKGKDVIYTPWFWRYIMLIINYIPERIFKKLSL